MVSKEPGPSQEFLVIQRILLMCNMWVRLVFAELAVVSPGVYRACINSEQSAKAIPCHHLLAQKFAEPGQLLIKSRVVFAERKGVA